MWKVILDHDIIKICRQGRGAGAYPLNTQGSLLKGVIEMENI